HSREGDPLAAKLAARLPHSFRVAPIRRDELRESSLLLRAAKQSGTRIARPSEKIAAPSPLFLPAKFTPYRFSMSSVFPVPDLPKDNPLIEERIALGRALFQEPRLSRDNSL